MRVIRPAVPVAVMGVPSWPAREARTHVGFAWRLAALWLTLPPVAALVAVSSPGVARVVYLQGQAGPAGLGALYVALGVSLLAVWATSFVARSVLVPGAATGDFAKDIGRRRATRIAVVVALTNLVALTAWTSATVEVWVFPLMTFSACQVVGILIERVLEVAPRP